MEGRQQAVALKVLHPNIVEKVNEDLRLLKGAALFLERIFPQLAILGPRRIVDDFGMRLTQQLDLTQVLY
jgi:predicted unusual protein kinase regulating ubiquinone biosynthesis (AarF/ABC1/UbiB family)